jgi:hypothetical protein
MFLSWCWKRQRLEMGDPLSDRVWIWNKRVGWTGRRLARRWTGKMAGRWTRLCLSPERDRRWRQYETLLEQRTDEEAKWLVGWWPKYKHGGRLALVSLNASVQGPWMIAACHSTVPRLVSCQSTFHFCLAANELEYMTCMDHAFAGLCAIIIR